MSSAAGRDVTASGVTLDRLRNLRRWNLGLSVLHLAQAIFVLVLASDFSIAITSSFPAGPPGTDVPAPEPLVDVRISVAIAVFLALAAVDHLVTATASRATYEADLRRGINRFRWVEYSFSATIMIVLICFYNQITGIAARTRSRGSSTASSSRCSCSL
jgi:hypothetical protein